MTGSVFFVGLRWFFVGFCGFEMVCCKGFFHCGFLGRRKWVLGSFEVGLAMGRTIGHCGF